MRKKNWRIFSGIAVVAVIGMMPSSSYALQMEKGKEQVTYVDGYNHESSPLSSEYDLSVNAIQAGAGNYQPGDEPIQVVDGNSATLWHTSWSGAPREQHYLTLDLGKIQEIDGIRVLPRQSGTNGMILRYAVEVSENGETFTRVAEGTWQAEMTWKKVNFQSTQARYVKLISLESMGDYSSLAEMRVTTPNKKKIPEKGEELKKLQEQLMNISEPITWLFTGDSITHGCDHSDNSKSFVQYFKHYITETPVLGNVGIRGKDKVLNTGVSAATAESLGFDVMFSNSQPDVVFIAFGMNDCARAHITLEKFKMNLRTYIDYIREAGAIPILQTQNTPRKNTSRYEALEPYTEAIRELAEEDNVILVDINKMWEEARSAGVNVDGVWIQPKDGGGLHPSSKGYLHWAQTIINELGLTNVESPLMQMQEQDIIPITDEEWIQLLEVEDLADDSQDATRVKNKFNANAIERYLFVGGDSVYGYNSIWGARNFVDHMEEVVRWENIGGTTVKRKRFFFNTGEKDLSLQTINEQYETYIGQYTPSLVGIMPELENETSVEEFEKNLKNILDKSVDRPVLLITPKPDQEQLQKGEAYAQTMIDLADERENVLVLDFYGAMIRLGQRNPEVYNLWYTQESELNQSGQLGLAKYILNSLQLMGSNSKMGRMKYETGKTTEVSQTPITARADEAHNVILDMSKVIANEPYSYHTVNIIEELSDGTKVSIGNKTMAPYITLSQVEEGQHKYYVTGISQQAEVTFALPISVIVGEILGENEVKVELKGKEKIYAGDFFTVTLQVDCREMPVYAGDIKVTYDQELLNYEGAEIIGEGVLAGEKQITPSTRRLLMTWHEKKLGKVELLQLKFKAKENLERNEQTQLNVDEMIFVKIETGNETLLTANTTLKCIAIQKATAQEDANRDGIIDISDMACVAYYYRITSSDPKWETAQSADVNKDGVIGFEDLAIIANRLTE